jgi:CDP-paratose 2-epimerase
MGRTVSVTYSDWRPGDQRVCVLDVRKAKRELAWRPRIDVEDGIARLHEWVVANRHLFA